MKKLSKKIVAKSAVGPTSYKIGSKVRLLNRNTLKPEGKVAKVGKPDKGEPVPGKGWFLVGDLWTHHTGMIPA